MNAPTFRLFLWPHRLLLIGPAFDTEIHCHHVAQLAIGLQGAIRIRVAESKPWEEAVAFYVPPDVSHGLDAGGTPCVLLYLDPEGVECEHARGRFGTEAIKRLDGNSLPLHTLQRLAAGEDDALAAERACADLLGREARTYARRAFDPRLHRALEWVDAHLDDDIRLGAVAGAVGVSESWLSHRFKEDIGVPLRRYVLWRRLRLAVEAALKGATLTEASHAAGLSDSAHLTRTFRDAFGVTPSFLFGVRGLLDVQFMD